MENGYPQVLTDKPADPAPARRAKTDWVSILLKAGAVLCVITSLLLVYLAGWFSVNGISRKDLRALDEEREASMDSASRTRNNKEAMDELIDSELFSSKKDFKAFFRETDSVLETILSCKWSLPTLSGVVKWADGAIKRYQNCDAEKIGWFFDFEAEDIVDEAGTVVKGVGTGLTALFILLGVVGLGAIASAFVNKLAAFRYIFAILLVLLLIVSIVGTVIANDAFLGLMDIGAEDIIEDATLAITATPVLCALFACGSVALNIIANKRKKERA